MKEAITAAVTCFYTGSQAYLAYDRHDFHFHLIDSFFIDRSEFKPQIIFTFVMKERNCCAWG